MNSTMKNNILSTTQSGSSPAGPGPCQPPRKVAVAMPAMTIMLMYSAMKNEPKRMPPNSVLKPPTISESPSARSNGGRLVSANPATRNTQKPTNWGTMYQRLCCAWTISVSDIDCAWITTPRRERPSAISYEISCAAERIAPRNEYFEPDAQPPSKSA